MLDRLEILTEAEATKVMRWANARPPAPEPDTPEWIRYIADAVILIAPEVRGRLGGRPLAPSEMGALVKDLVMLLYPVYAETYYN